MSPEGVGLIIAILVGAVPVCRLMVPKLIEWRRLKKQVTRS